MIVDNRPVRIIGVVSRDFWFLDIHPVVWTLYDSGVTWRSFPGVLGGAVCRLKPGVIPWEVEAELRVLARQIKPTHSGSWVTVTPLREMTSRPVVILAPLWNGLMIAAGLFRTRTLDRAVLHERASWSSLKYPGFFLLKCVFAFTIILLATAEFCASAAMTNMGGVALASGIASLWAGLVGAVGALYLCWRDQRKRCRLCLCRLVMPVRIGYGARQLFEQSGAETVCPNGHGTLFESEGGAFPPRLPVGASRHHVARPV